MGRREELLDAATDYVLEHGLTGLSLRPLAAALGTSDRMLVYHFGNKDALVSAVLQESNRRSITLISRLQPSPDARRAVHALWEAVSNGQVAACTRIYVEASCIGLFGAEPYAGAIRSMNGQWMAALTAHLVASGATRRTAPRLAALVDATFLGLVLDAPLEDDKAQRRVVADLADAVAALA